MPVYVYYFVDTPWIKVGFDINDVIQRATDGFWENSHPQELCYKLDIRHAHLWGVWDMTKTEEESLHKHFHGPILRRYEHNEFYSVYDWPVIRDYLNQYSQIDNIDFHPPYQIPNVKFHKRRDTCCGGTALFCQACQRTIRKEWKRHLRTKKHLDNSIEARRK